MFVSASNPPDLSGNPDIFQSDGGRSGNFLKNPDTFAFTGRRKIPLIGLDKSAGSVAVRQFLK